MVLLALAILVRLVKTWNRCSSFGMLAGTSSDNGCSPSDGCWLLRYAATGLSVGTRNRAPDATSRRRCSSCNCLCFVWLPVQLCGGGVARVVMPVCWAAVPTTDVLGMVWSKPVAPWTVKFGGCGSMASLLAWVRGSELPACSPEPDPDSTSTRCGVSSLLLPCKSSAGGGVLTNVS